MKGQMNVLITRRNAKQEPVHTELFSFKDYTDSLRQDLLYVISDIESAFYAMNDGKSKDEWPDDVWASFTRIKHKLLDKAGDIGRLPENIVEAGVPPCR